MLHLLSISILKFWFYGELCWSWLISGSLQAEVTAVTISDDSAVPVSPQ